MKKLWVLLLLIMISPMFSCDESASENEMNAASLLYMFGNKTLTVNVTYTGPGSILTLDLVP